MTVGVSGYAMMRHNNASAEVKRFLAGDLSHLKRRYEERFTKRLSYDGRSALTCDQDELDREIQAWATAKELAETIPHIIRSQPYENAERVFRDLQAMIGTWESSRGRSSPLARCTTTNELDWLLALLAISDMFDTKVSARWIFETLRLFWSLDAVAEWMHTPFPGDFFAVSRDLLWRTDRFRRYCEGLGVDLEWPGIDGTAVDAYWEVNVAIRAWADDNDMEPWQLWAVFEHLAPKLFPDESGPLPDTGHVWIAMSSEVSFTGLDDDKEETATWTVNPGVRRGDIVLMYCMAPRKAITHRYRALCDAYEDPFDDLWTSDQVNGELGEREALPWITLDEMRADPILSTWGVVRSNFQGARKTIVPSAVWRRIEHLVEVKRSDPNWVQRAATDLSRGEDGSRAKAKLLIPPQEEAELEREFEERAVKPLLQGLGLDLMRRAEQQKPIRMYVGSRRVTNRADFVLYVDDDRQEPFAVIEAKRSIDEPEQLNAARQQAESYAGYLRVPSFAVIAPQGIWLYELVFPGQSKEVAKYSLEEAAREPKRTLLARALGLQAQDEN